MHIISQKSYDAYLDTDEMLNYLRSVEQGFEKELTCQKWLRDNGQKRHIASLVYGDALKHSGMKILDVGSGLTSLQRILSEVSDLKIIEKMAHDPSVEVAEFLSKCPKLKVLEDDWFNFETDESFDLVIANDLFPNVDQRLSLFLEKFLPKTKKIIISATYYQEARFYETKRTNADEYLYYLAWDARALCNALQPFENRIIGYDSSAILNKIPSIFPNGRSVVVCEIKGDLY